MKRFFAILLIGFGLINISHIGLSQESEEPFRDAYQKHFKKDYFSIGAVMQYVFDYQNERKLAGNNGFSIANMRLQLKGKFDSGFGYFFQTNFVSSPPILDAYMYYSQSPAFQLQIGQFKSPFSKEFLIPAPDIDFVNRSRVVAALAPGRQIGFQVNGFIADNLVNYQAGIFNGNGVIRNNNDSGNFLYAGRIALFPKLFDNEKNGSLEIGVNSAFSKDSSADIVGGIIPAFSGKRMLIGADFRFNYDNLLLASEYIQAKLEQNTGEESLLKGFHTTAAYMVAPKVQLLLRWDQFDLDNLNSTSDWLIWGVNFWPTSITELQLNYIVDMDNSDMKYHQVLINAQIVF